MLDKNGLTEEEFLKTYNSDKYPKPSVTADIVVIAHDGENREVLLVKRGGHPFIGHWATPGGFANKNEPIEHTAARELKEETGISGLPLKLVGVYSKPGRDPRGWTISCAFKADVPKGELSAHAGDDASDAKWFKVDQGKYTCGDLVITDDDLAFDHSDILHDALAM